MPHTARACAWFALATVVLMPAWAAPSTFGPIIGSGLLCRSELDNLFYYSYLSNAFGPSYKHEGGAYWFKADATLWGTSITDVIVSDDSAALVFLGAVAEVGPEKLDQAIRAAVGARHIKTDESAFPVRESGPGSRIVYFDAKSKIYCAKFKPGSPGR